MHENKRGRNYSIFSLYVYTYIYIYDILLQTKLFLSYVMCLESRVPEHCALTLN